MKKIIKTESLPEFFGQTNVIKDIYDNGTILFHTVAHPFKNEVLYTGATKLNINEDNWGHWFYLFKADNTLVGKYAMKERLWEFTAKQLAEQKNKLFFFYEFNHNTKSWEPYIDGTPAKVSVYKEGCGLATILNGGKWYVVDKENSYVVPPGKYDYIDGYDKCGLARVKISGKAHIFDPKKSTRDRWGIIDMKGNEVLPLIYSEIWPFYNKNRQTTTVWKGDKLTGLDDGIFYDYYQERVYKYDFVLKTRELRIKEDWSQGNYNCLDPKYNWDPSDEYTIWDAFEGDPEAAAAADFEW